MALSWLFTQRQQPLQFLGVVTVAGNTTVQNATNNAVLVLKQLGRQDVPVVMGAAAPLVQPLTKTSLVYPWSGRPLVPWLAESAGSERRAYRCSCILL